MLPTLLSTMTVDNNNTAFGIAKASLEVKLEVKMRRYPSSRHGHVPIRSDGYKIRQQLLQISTAQGQKIHPIVPQCIPTAPRKCSNSRKSPLRLPKPLSIWVSLEASKSHPIPPHFTPTYPYKPRRIPWDICHDSRGAHGVSPSNDHPQPETPHITDPETSLTISAHPAVTYSSAYYPPPRPPATPPKSPASLVVAAARRSPRGGG